MVPITIEAGEFEAIMASIIEEQQRYLTAMAEHAARLQEEERKRQQVGL